MEEQKTAIAPQPPEPTVCPQPPKSDNRFKIIKWVSLAIVLLVVIIDLAKFGAQYLKKQNAAKLAATPTQTPTLDRTEDWSLYKNEKYGFEFKYPGNKVADFQEQPYNGFCNDNKRLGLVGLQLLPLGTKLPILHELEANDVNFFVYGEENLENISVDKWIKKNCPQVLSGFKAENTTIAGLSALKFTRTGEGMGDGEIQPYIFFSRNNDIFYIHPYGDKLIFDQILSTFKFTDSSKQIGFVKKAYYELGQPYLDIDYVEWLDGSVGEKACVEDKKCPAGCIQGHTCGETYASLNNGYYIRNNNPQIRTLAVAKNSTIGLVDMNNTDDLSQSKLIDFNTFQKYISENITQWGELANEANLFWITLSNGKIIKITEQYRP